MKISIQRHLIIALVMGFFLRLISLIFVWGPQGLDDYLDNIIPAWRHLMHMEPDLHNYRSPLYMWILSLWLRIGEFFGIQNAVSQIQWIYFLQALTSLLAIYGVYLITRKSKNQLTPILAVYLVAMHGLMPFASTRAFMESFVIGLITIGLAILNEQFKEKKESLPLLLSGFLILGFATLVRFQVGIIYVAWLGLMFFQKNKKQFWTGFLFGFVLIFAEALIDVGYGRAPFQTLHDYFVFNSNQENAGVMPWYNTWITWLGALYFPFSALFWKGWKKAFTENWRIFIPVLIYVIAHSLNPHKEERYLYPILALSFVFMASAWAESFKTKAVRWIYNPFFLIFNTFVLCIGCFVNTQVGLVGPMGEIQAISNKVLYLDYDNMVMRNYMAPFFVRSPSKIFNVDTKLDAQEALQQFLSEKGLEYLALMSTSPEHESFFKSAYSELSKKLICSPLQTATSLSDKVLYYLRPDRNLRRRPTLYFYCKRG